MVYPDKMDYKDVLYHFTDVSALKNILETRELRFTYFKDLNDQIKVSDLAFCFLNVELFYNSVNS